MKVPDIEAIVFDLRQTADDDDIEAMIRAVAAIVARYFDGPDSATPVRDALAAIAGAKAQHEAAEMLEGASPVRLLTVLRHAAADPGQAAKYLARVDPAISAAAYSHLWHAAIELGHLRFEDADEGRRMLIRVRSDWRPVPRGRLSFDRWPAAEDAIEGWLAVLATDIDRFREIAEYAAGLADAERKPPDLQRPLRDLARRPTLRKLENIIARDGGREVSFEEDAIRRAVWDLELLGSGDVPDDWLRQLKERFAKNLPDVIGRIAVRALRQLQRGSNRPGRRHDHFLEAYVARIAGIFESIAHRAITYTKTTDVHETPHTPRGLGLDFMLAAMRLLDPATTPYQAAEQIDRVRKERRRRPASARSRR